MTRYSWDKNGKTFVNPYNFVPFSKADQTIDGTKTEGKLHTGYLDCRLYTLTPLAIPDTDKKIADKEQKEHYYYPFMRENNHKIIPGSSLRGVIRSIYETVTDSCMVTSRDEAFSQRVSPNEAYHPAILMRNSENKWELFEAERKKRFDSYKAKDNSCKDENGKRYSWGDYVVYSEGDSTIKGYAFIGESFSRKRSEGVFVKKKLLYQADDPELQAAIRGLDETIQVYRDKSVNRNIEAGTHSGYKGYDHAKEGGVIPLWYFHDANGHLYLSPAAIGRKTFFHTMKSFVGEPCSDRTRLCKACALFGMIGRKDGAGYGSKVRVTDAICQKDTQTSKVTLKELGSPRTSYLPFYSVDGKKYDEADAQIRGRKFYWHNMEAQNGDHSYRAENSRQMQTKRSSEFSGKTIENSGEKTKRNATMELLNPGAEFTFRVYFDQVSTQQLQELEWVLTFGENTRESELCYKIGHGKPLGLGSAKIIIEKQVERSLTGDSYALQVCDVPKTIEPQQLQNSASYKDLLTISRFDAMKDIPVCYPYIVSDDYNDGRKLSENTLASHQWFSEFRRDKDVLPTISEMAARRKLLKPYRVIGTGEQRIPCDLKNESSASSSSQAGRIKDAKASASFANTTQDLNTGITYCGVIDSVRKHENGYILVDKISVLVKFDMAQFAKKERKNVTAGVHVEFQVQKTKAGGYIALNCRIKE